MKTCKYCGAEIVQPKKTIKIKELNIEVETKISQKGKSFNEIKIPKGWRLLKAQEFITLYQKYAKELNMLDTWEFVEQPFKFNKQKGYVAKFSADFGRADLDCYWDPNIRDSGLGVRFCRDLK